jgi:hypothetical protein
MASFIDRYVNSVADKLIADGKKLIADALSTKTYEHDTYNLHDSYGAGVYYKGRLIREYYNTPSKAKEPKKNLGKSEYGKDNIRDYLHSEYKPTTNGIVLVVIATMFYGEILESGDKHEIFSNKELLKKAHLKAPITTEILYTLKEKGYNVDTTKISIDEVVEEIIKIKKD